MNVSSINPPHKKLAKVFCLVSLLLPMAGTVWAALPAGWSDADIGSPGLAGSAGYTNGLWTVTGGGADIWGASDQFNYASTNYTGDGTMIVRVNSLQNTDSSGWSKAGLMFRNDSTAGSANVTIVATATQGVSFQWRSTAGGSSLNSQHGGITAPVWLKLVRAGANFTGYYSTNGSNWAQVSSQSVTMNNTVMAGFDVTAHNNSALNTSTFTNFSLGFIPTPPVNVTINATNVINTVPTNAFGIFMAVWDTWGGSTPTQLKQSGITTMRYPGGSYADSYDWSRYQMIPAFGQAGNLGYLSGSTDMGHFIGLMSNAQAQAVISVDWGSGFLWNSNKTALAIPSTNGSPQEAAAWVAYCNASTNIYGTTNDVTIGMDALGNNWQTAGYWAMIRAGSALAQDDGYNFLRINHPAPVGIQYWEVGNEPYGNGYYGGGDSWECDYAVPYPYTNHTRAANALLSPAAYGQAVKAFSIAMKAVDPTIKVGAYSSTPPGDYSWDYINGVNSGQHWTPQVLAQCGSNIDFVIVHWYPGFSDNVGTSLLSEVGSTIPVMINGTGPYPHTGTNSGLEDWITNYCPNPANVQILVTEFGADNYPYLVNGTNGMPILGPVEALFAADCYSTWLNYPAFANADWLDFDGSSFLGSGNGPVFYAIQMLRHLCNPGDAFVKATSDTGNLRVQGVARQDGNLGILLINESMNSSQTVQVTVTNANLNTTGIIYQFGANNWTISTNEVPATGPSSNSISSVGSTFSVTLPAYTMDVLVVPTTSSGIFSPALQVTPGSIAYGTIPERTSATNSFTVQNVGTGTLSGTATVAAPFSIVSGGSYSLGSNASQSVVVAFNPTAAGNYTNSVVFTGAGGTNVTVTGSATNPTILLPSILVPPGNQTANNGDSATFSVTVSGALPLSYQWQFNGTNLPNYSGVIKTVAGDGSGGYSGDGSVATNATFNLPNDVAVDAFGNMFIADSGNNVIRKINTSGIITTVAGNRNAAYSGDGGQATNTSLNEPNGVAVDALGNIYIADTANSRIRKVSTNGIITTVAGNGSFGYLGDGGQAINASLYEPDGVAVDALGNIYIADTGNSRIRKVSTNGIITTVAGNGNFGYLGDGGQATNASLNGPSGIKADSQGDVYIADGGDIFVVGNSNQRIRKVSTNGIITTVAGDGVGAYSGDGGPATNANLSWPFNVALDASGNLFIADSQNHRIRAVGTNGIITTVAGNGNAAYSGDGGAATSASLDEPHGVAVDALGNLYIADSGNNVIREVESGSTLVISNVTTANAGNYTVVVSNEYGSVTGSVATLAIVTPPSSQTVSVGQTAVLAVQDTTTPLSYQWEAGATGSGVYTNLTDAGNISGSATATLSITNATLANAGDYVVLVSNLSSSVISAPAATLTVNMPAPPTLAPISNYTVNVGQTVAFTASATDSNQPPPTLTFSLLSAPTNATLDPNSGAFSFRPLVSQANTTNPISLEVTDSGNPPLSATQSFSVSVNPLALPQFSSAGWANGQFVLQVSGQGGPDYEIQTSTNLTQWSAVFTTNSPAMPFSWQDMAATNAAGFYRVVVGPPLP